MKEVRDSAVGGYEKTETQAKKAGFGRVKRSEARGGARPSGVAVAPLAAAVVDHQRHAPQPVSLSQPIFHKEPVVARQRTDVVNLNREARRADVVLGHVDHLEPL